MFKTILKLINFYHGFDGFVIFFTGLSINTYQNLEEMASRLHSKKEKKQEKTKRVSLLRDVEDMFFGLTM